MNRLKCTMATARRPTLRPQMSLSAHPFCTSSSMNYRGTKMRKKAGQKHVHIWGLKNYRGFVHTFFVAMWPGAIVVHAAMERLPRANQNAIRCA